MDELLKSFQVGILLRSVFAGVFFVISFCTASPNLIEINSDNIIRIGLPFALIAGVIVYTLHRSIAYPWIEWGCCAEWAKKLRKTCLPLISSNSVQKLADKWDAKSQTDEGKSCKRSEQAAVWADYAHMQYTAAWCIILGASISTMISDTQNHFYSPLIWMTVVFFVAALVSDWRLHSVQEKLPKLPEVTKVGNPN